MKLHRGMLETLIELPSKDPQVLRGVLDDLGLEVKGIEESHDVVFNIETLANRGDHLSALGVAREISARLLIPVKLPSIATIPDNRPCSVKLEVTTPLCSKAALLEMVVPHNLPTPPEVKAALGDTGKPALVDILNYVLLEIGQPMHCWDRETIHQKIVFSESDKEHTFEALIGKTFKVPAGSIIGSDQHGIADVAGVVGSKATMTTHNTTRVLIVSCCFDPVSIRKTSRAMHLSTDASYVFERGNDREAVLFGLRRAAHLIQAAAVSSGSGAQILGLSVVENGPVENRKVEVSIPTIRSQLGLPKLAEMEVTSRLKHLGYRLAETDKKLIFQATVPSWRLWDVKNPEDVVEDFARSYSLTKVKLQLPDFDEVIPALNHSEQFISTIEPALLGGGFTEVVTKGFYSADDVKLLGTLHPSLMAQHVAIRNSVESSFSHLKHTNILHLARIAESNRRRDVLSVKVFEFGRLFLRDSNTIDALEHEFDVLTLGVAGRWNVHDWRKSETVEELLFKLKGTIETLLRALGVRDVMIQSGSSSPYLHPGMQAEIRVGAEVGGVFGVIHPQLREAVGLKETALYAEINRQKIQTHTVSHEMSAPSDFPMVWRDLTLKVGQKVSAGSVLPLLRGKKIAALSEVRMVDEFKRNDEDFRRVSYRLIFQALNRTLESSEVDAEMNRVLKILEKAGFPLA